MAIYSLWQYALISHIVLIMPFRECVENRQLEQKQRLA